MPDSPPVALRCAILSMGLLSCGAPVVEESSRGPVRFGEAISVEGACAQASYPVGPGWVCDLGSEVRTTTPTTLPEPAPPDAVWRCTGGTSVRCALYPTRPFVCREGTCVQPHPRLPDDSDWECSDVEGLVVCRNRLGPSGAIAGPPSEGWRCGALRGSASTRICVDAAPERPGAGSYDCHFEHEPSMARICERSEAPVLGAPCSGTCPEGMRCADRVCVPERFEVPDCWTHADCADGQRCVLAHCEAP